MAGARAEVAFDPAIIVLVAVNLEGEVNSAGADLPPFSAILGNFTKQDLISISSDVGYGGDDKCLLLLKKNAQTNAFESMPPAEEGLLSLPFDFNYESMKKRLGSPALAEVPQKLADAWVETKALQTMFDHTVRIYGFPALRKSYGEAALAQAGTASDRHKRLCLGLVAFDTHGYAGFEAYEKDWEQVSDLIQNDLRAKDREVPDTLASYCASEVFTQLASKVDVANFAKLWALMRRQKGDLKGKLLTSLVLHPFLKPRDPIKRG